MHGLCHQDPCRSQNSICTPQVALPWSQSHPKEVLSSGQDAPLEQGARSWVWFRTGALGSQPSLVKGSSISCEGVQEPLSLPACAQVCEEGNSWFSKDKILKLTAFKFPVSTWEMLCKWQAGSGFHSHVPASPYRVYLPLYTQCTDVPVPEVQGISLCHLWKVAQVPRISPGCSICLLFTRYLRAFVCTPPNQNLPHSSQETMVVMAWDFGFHLLVYFLSNKQIKNRRQERQLKSFSVVLLCSGAGYFGDRVTSWNLTSGLCHPCKSRARREQPSALPPLDS